MSTATLAPPTFPEEGHVPARPVERPVVPDPVADYYRDLVAQNLDLFVGPPFGVTR